MIDFKIRRGLSHELFPEAGKINPRLKIEEGCWYLCTDTADLYLGVNTGEELTLKRINDKASNTPTINPDDSDNVDELLEVYINENGELTALYSVSGEIVIGSVVSKEYVDSEIAKIEIPEINLDAYAKKSDIPDVKDFITKTDLEDAIDKVEHPTINLDNYATKEDLAAIEIPSVEGLATEKYVDDKISELNITDIPDLSEYAKLSDIPSHDEFVNKNDLQETVNNISALEASVTKERYEVLAVPGLEVIYRDDEIRVNTEHIELTKQNVGAGGESNVYYIGIKIYAPTNAESMIQNITSAPGIQDGKERVYFTSDDIDEYGRKYSNAWVKCAVYQNGAWTNYGLSSTIDKCLGYYYTVEWYDINGNVIENDSIHVVFTNDSCHYSSISDATSRRFVEVNSSINNIEQNYVQNSTLENYVTNEYITEQQFVTNNYIVENYSTTEQIAATYVTEEKITEVVTDKVETIVTEQVETIIQEKVDAGEIEIKKAESITYDTF